MHRCFRPGGCGGLMAPQWGRHQVIDLVEVLGGSWLRASHHPIHHRHLRGTARQHGRQVVCRLTSLWRVHGAGCVRNRPMAMICRSKISIHPPCVESQNTNSRRFGFRPFRGLIGWATPRRIGLPTWRTGFACADHYQQPFHAPNSPDGVAFQCVSCLGIAPPHHACLVCMEPPTTH